MYVLHAEKKVSGLAGWILFILHVLHNLLAPSFLQLLITSSEIVILFLFPLTGCSRFLCNPAKNNMCSCTDYMCAELEGKINKGPER